MKETVFRALYNQFMFFSDNGVEPILHPAIAMSEACKCSGRPREDVRELLMAFEKYGLVKRSDHENLAYLMTELGTDSKKVKELIVRLTTS